MERACISQEGEDVRVRVPGAAVRWPGVGSGLPPWPTLAPLPASAPGLPTTSRLPAAHRNVAMGAHAPPEGALVLPGLHLALGASFPGACG